MKRIDSHKSFLRMVLASAFLFFGAATAYGDIYMHTYPNYDAPGNDIESIIANGVGPCMANCRERAACTAAVYNKADGRCWLKSAARGIVQSQVGTLGIKILTFRDGIDYPGGDYHNYESRTVQNCSRTCFMDQRCKAFTFNKETRVCWLKSAIVDASFNSVGVSGRK